MTKKKETFAFSCVFYTVKVSKLCSYNAFLIYKPCSRTKRLHQQGGLGYHDRTDGGNYSNQKNNVHTSLGRSFHEEMRTNPLNGSGEKQVWSCQCSFSALLV